MFNKILKCVYEKGLTFVDKKLCLNDFTNLKLLGLNIFNDRHLVTGHGIIWGKGYLCTLIRLEYL